MRRRLFRGEMWRSEFLEDVLDNRVAGFTMKVSPPIPFRIEWADSQGNVTASWLAAHFNFRSVPSGTGIQRMMRLPHRMGKALLGIVGVLSLLYLYGALNLFLFRGLYAGKLLQHAVSPDGRNVAEWTEDYTSSTTTSDTFTVQLHARFNPLRQTVLMGEVASKPSISWIDTRNLLVECRNCGTFELGNTDECKLYWVGNEARCQEFRIYRKETTWHDVTIHYGRRESR